MLASRLFKSTKFSYRYISSLPTNIPINLAKSLIKNEINNMSMSSDDKDNRVRNLLYSQKIQKKYLPFYSVDIKGLVSEYSVKYKLNNSNDSTIVSNKSNPITYPLGTLSTQIYASFEYPRKIIEDILNTKNLNQLSITEIDRDSIVSQHQMNLSFALHKIINKIKIEETERIKQIIKNKYNTNNIEIIDINLLLDDNNTDIHGYHLPIYVYELDEKYSPYIFVNAYNGIIHNDLKYFYPTRLSSLLFHNKNNKIYEKRMKQIFEDITQNNEFSTTYENEQISITHYIDTSPEHYKFLNLKINNDITIEILKEARNNMLKKWHPDVASDKILAQHMCIKINDAYEKIKNEKNL